MYFKLGIWIVGVIIILVAKSFLWELMGIGLISILIVIKMGKQKRRLRKLSLNELRRRGIK